MNNEVEQDKELHVASDWGKLELAGRNKIINNLKQGILEIKKVLITPNCRLNDLIMEFNKDDIKMIKVVLYWIVTTMQRLTLKNPA